MGDTLTAPVRNRGPMLDTDLSSPMAGARRGPIGGSARHAFVVAGGSRDIKNR